MSWVITPFRKKTLKPAWQYAAIGVIWRLVPLESGNLVGEERDIEKKSVAFFCVEGAGGRVLWEKRSFGEQWWIGIEAVHGDRLFLHKFATPELPVHKGIIAVDLKSGTVQWSHEELRFIDATDDSVFASGFSQSGEELFRLDVATGAITERLGSDAVRVQPIVRRGEMAERAITLPVIHSQHGLSDIRRYLADHHAAGQIVGNVEMLEEGEYLVFNYNVQPAGSKGNTAPMRSELKVYEKRQAKLVLEETLRTHAGAIMPEPFFVFNGMLLYIKNQRLLTAVSLSDAS